MRRVLLLLLLFCCMASPSVAYQHLTGYTLNGARWGQSITSLPPSFGTPSQAPNPMQTDLQIYPYRLPKTMMIGTRPFEGFVSSTANGGLNGILYRYTGAATYDIAMAAFREVSFSLAQQYGKAVNESTTGTGLGIVGHEHYRYRWQQQFTTIVITADFDNGIGEIFIEYLPR